ncbi:hypothetical protein EIP91_004656 [Steccherinum ochraceum]|uniref:Uncharacterized protein n=1 Tax=Steccherinum ochraceum TaxID=92696 RepID=A0A4R0R960_9APHY|nr:hypothetical protein EIP91_004656 [Steccherinum ochraceum]
MAVHPKTKAEPVEPTIPKPPRKSKDALEKDRQGALKSITEFRRATAWEVHRWPLTKFVLEERVKVHLPRSFRQRSGEEVKPVYAGVDLNQFVHNYYMEMIDVVSSPPSDANFVTEENIRARRHEFLGPDPRVVGYSYDNFGEIHIKWWDKFLQEQWMDREKWTFELMLSEDEQWVAADLH